MTIKARKNRNGEYTFSGVPEVVAQTLADFGKDVSEGYAYVVWDPALYDPRPMRPKKAAREGLAEFCRSFEGDFSFEERWKYVKRFKKVTE